MGRTRRHHPATPVPVDGNRANRPKARRPPKWPIIGHAERTAESIRTGYYTALNRGRPIPQMVDEIVINANALAEDHVDNDLIYYLLMETTHLPRNTDLPLYAKRKALLWMREHRDEWTESDKLSAYAAALPFVMDGSRADAFLQRWMREKRQDLNVQRMNKHFEGKAIPRKGFFARIVSSLGFVRTADRMQIRSAYTVLPNPT